MSGCGCEVEIKDHEQGRVLIILLLINASMFVIEIVFGVISQSTALIADSLDMLADATVYGIGLYAVGRSARVKIHAAYSSGISQVILGLFVLFDVLRRFITGSEPDYFFMFTVGIIALIANVICLILISRHRDGEVHMRASWIFSKNDVVANLGILLAAGLVYYSGSRYPDLFIGMAISLIVVHGGYSIIKQAREEKKVQADYSATC